MGDKEGAREILNEVLAEGNDNQKADAKGMLSSLG
jgi:pilus assembly protein FimV